LVAKTRNLELLCTGREIGHRWIDRQTDGWHKDFRRDNFYLRPMKYGKVLVSWIFTFYDFLHEIERKTNSRLSRADVPTRDLCHAYTTPLFEFYFEILASGGFRVDLMHFLLRISIKKSEACKFATYW
jgi:hypothetical protein